MSGMSEQVRAAVLGAIAGWTLGAQCRGRRGWRRLTFYDPIPPRMAQSPALESWLVASAYLRSGNPPELYARALADGWKYPIDECAIGLGQVARGLVGPASGSFNNPVSRASEAIGRAVYWGLALHGLPEEAARRAYFDASADHDSDGTWVPVAVARTVACLAPGKTASDVLRDLTNSLPKESKLRAAIPIVLKFVGNPDGQREAREAVESTLRLADPYDAALTGAWLVLGLAFGGGKFEPSVLATAGCGGAAGHATLACGAIAGFLEGSVPLAWTKHLGDTFIAGHGLHGIEPSKSIESFVKTVVEDSSRFSFVTPVVEEAAPVEGEAAPAKPVFVSTPLSNELAALLAKRQDTVYAHSGALTVSMQYVDSPVAYPATSLKLALGFKNDGDVDLTFVPSVEPPQGWEIAHKIVEFVLPPGASSTFPLVVKRKGDMAAIESVRVTTPFGEVSFPVFASQLWYWVGPMTNQEGTGFDRSYPAETNIKLGQVFNGRSNMPVEWKSIHLPGERIDVEHWFGNGPGVIYLYCEARMPKPGRYKLVAASGVGVIAWIDERKAFWYHDTHTPVPRAVEPYVGAFETEGTVRVLLKTFRNLDPVPPMSVYFLNEDGTLAVPIGFEPVR